jgi:hypothetical protein
MGWLAMVRFLLEVSYFSLLQNVEIVSATHPASYPMGTRVLFLGEKYQSVTLTTHLHLMPRARMMELYLHLSLSL